MTPFPTRETLLDRARALVPLLADRAEATERNRALLSEIRDALREADLFRIVQGPYLGGYGLDMATHFEVAAELARGCASTAWVQCLVAYQNFLVGWYPRAAQDEVLADGAPLFAGLVMAATEDAEAAPGGVRLTGRWPYVSGIDDANWLMLTARAPEDRGRPLTCLVPRSEVAIDDDWRVLGLRGTGSKAAVLDRVFVPDHRVLAFRETDSRGVPGAEVNPGPYYRGIPTTTLFVMVVAAPATGIAEAAIEAYRERLRTRYNPRMPSVQTEWPSSQAKLGRARAAVDQARRTFFDAVAELTAWVEHGGELTAEQRSRLRFAVVESVRLSTEAVYDLFCDAGTGVARDGDPLQRCFRDIHVLRSHFMLSPDQAAENAGRVQLGLPPKPPFL